VSSEQIEVYTKVIDEKDSLLLRSTRAKENLYNESQYSRPKIRMLIFGKMDPYSSQSDITDILSRAKIVQ
jgi:flagellar biosynthesis GTPase FlhF